MRKLSYWLVAGLLLAGCAATPTPTTPAPTSPAATAAAPTTMAATPSAAGTSAAATAAPTSAGTSAPAATSAAAGTQPVVSATELGSTPGAVQPVTGGEVVKLSGNSFTSSETYRFAADTTLDVSWAYTGTAPFALWLINVSENVTDPNYDRILIDDITGPHAGAAKEKIIAGDWQIQVEQGEGPWTVQFTPES